MKKSLQKIGVFTLGLALVLPLLGPVSASAEITKNMCSSLVRDLTLGSTGSDVVALQTFLEEKGYLTIPAGVSKGYFGSLTRSAVSRYQSDNAIYPTAGYFGPLTRGKLVSACVQMADKPGVDNNDGVLKGGDGDFKDFDVLGNPSNETVNEGNEEAVLGFEFRADDSDLKIERVDISLAGNSGERPWKYLESISLYYGTKKVSEIDASNKNEWDEIGSSDTYEATFSNVKSIVREDQLAKMYIHVEAKDSIDDSDLPIEWTIEIPNDGIRAVNAEGINVYEGNINETFDLDVADSSDLKVTYKSSENEDQTIEVEDTTKVTEDVLLYTFKIEPQDGDVNIDQVDVTIGTTTGTVDSVESILKNVRLVIDGDEVGSESGDTSVSFEDLDLDLSEDDEVEVEVYADVEGTDDGDQFTTGAGVKVTGVVIDYIDSQDDDQTADELISKDGGDITFYTQGISANFVSSNAQVKYGSYSGDNDRGTFSITFKVTAFGDEDIYIGGANTTGSSNNGISYELSSSTAASITKAELTSDAEEGDNDTFIVSAGDTEEFTFEVEISDVDTSAIDVAQKLTITGIKWDVDDDSTPDETYDVNLDDFKTASKTI